MKNYIIFGSPGAGKGTQAELIAEKRTLVHLSSGELLRQEVISGSELGNKIKSYQDQGTLVPNELLTKLMENSVKNNLNSNGFIFDGYPRSIEQANILDSILKKHNLEIDMVLNLQITEEEALRRLLLRGETSGRSDDNEEVINNRFKIHHEETEPILDYYQKQKKLVNLAGEGAIEDIALRIEEEVNKI